MDSSKHLESRPSPQPSSEGRGGRPRCLALSIDLKNPVDYGLGKALGKPTLTPALFRREREPTEVSGAVHRPEKSGRLWIRQSTWKADPPQPSPGGRGGRPRCLALSIDLKNPVDYGLVKALGKPTLTPALSRRERGPTEVSGAVHRPEKSSRLWIGQSTWKADPHPSPLPEVEGADRGVWRCPSI
jgi:hypothetical protein